MAQGHGHQPFHPHKSSHLCLAALLRLGLPLLYSEDIHTCDCGKTITDSSRYHQITYKSGGGPVWMHNNIVSLWSDCSSKIKIHCKREPRETCQFRQSTRHQCSNWSWIQHECEETILLCTVLMRWINPNESIIYTNTQGQQNINCYKPFTIS